MKITKKDRQLLVAFAGILIAACAYFIVFQKYAEKTEIIEAQNQELASEVTRLEALDAKRDTYLEYTDMMKNEIATFENRFPADILEEDSIMTVKILEDNTNTEVATIGLGSASEVVYTGATQTATSEEGTVATGDMVATTTYADTHMYEVPLGITISCTYEDFKGLIRYIYSEQYRMSVKGVNVSYDAANNQLSGNMTLNTYYLLGTEKQYVPVDIPSMQYGVETVFGNIQ